ncbi:hypothetical protein [Polaribacter sp. Q13]|uniref:hypothetical protein n=1 Tax=Polaribacter sp. Q13 TaxID=2806551 RepID=UPI00193C21E9|nr:hypothetical protein [Polaribacter sp. Q13]QVY64624.1 hypothetical protein JOP69_12705 [Polaribacter sp. Q13]
MKLLNEQQKSEEFLASIYTKAQEDENFKQELIANPIATLNTFTGKEVNFPAGIELIVVD